MFGKRIHSSVFLSTISAGILLLSGAIAPSGGPFTTPAFAATFYTCYFPHCYDLGAAENSYAGVLSDWPDRSILMPSSEVNDMYHLSNEQWLMMPNGQWVEEGMARGCSVYVLDETCSQAGGTDELLQFWADANSSLQFFFHPIGEIDSDGVTHYYMIWDSSGGANDHYQVDLDGSQVGTSRVQEYSSGDALNVGMELYSPGINSGEFSGANKFQNQVSNYINSQGYWNNTIFDSNTITSYPCGGTDNCAMDDCTNFSHGDCLYWFRASGDQWNDYKPS